MKTSRTSDCTEPSDNDDRPSGGSTRKAPRRSLKKKCIVEPVCADPGMVKPVVAEAMNFSEGGIEIRHEGSDLPVGLKVLVFVGTLGIAERRAEVVWSKRLSGRSRSGLRWI